VTSFSHTKKRCTPKPEGTVHDVFYLRANVLRTNWKSSVTTDKRLSALRNKRKSAQPGDTIRVNGSTQAILRERATYCSSVRC